jgi:hypothetical protein
VSVERWLCLGGSHSIGCLESVSNQRKKIKDEVGAQSISQLLLESQQWLMRTGHPGAHADQERSLRDLAVLVTRAQRENADPDDPVYAKAKERLALYCEKQRWNNGGATPAEIRP